MGGQGQREEGRENVQVNIVNEEEEAEEEEGQEGGGEEEEEEDDCAAAAATSLNPRAWRSSYTTHITHTYTYACIISIHITTTYITSKHITTVYKRHT